MVQSVLVGDRAVPKHSSTKLTHDDYLQLPDDGLRHEIIEGEHYVTPAPSMRHQPRRNAHDSATADSADGHDENDGVPERK